MVPLLRQRNFVLLWLAGLVSLAGDWALLAVLPFYVYERTDSTLASAMVWLSYALPGLLVGSVAGVFVDRWDRRRTLVLANLAAGVVVFGLLSATRPGWLWVIYPVIFLEGTLRQFLGPAESALLPRLVGEERLLSANALNALNDNLGRIAGPVVGGGLVAIVGLPGAVLVDAASFLLAAGLVALIAAPSAATRARGRSADDAEAVATVAPWWREWAAGLGVVRAEAPLRALFLVAAVAVFADSIQNALFVPFVRDVVVVGAGTFGTILSVRGVSGLLGAAVVARWGARVSPEKLLAWSLVAIGVGLTIILAVPTLPVLLIVLVALGPAIQGWLTSQQTLLQLATTDAFRGRVFGAFGTSASLMLLLGGGLAATIGELVPVLPLLLCSAGLYVSAGVVGRVLLTRRAAIVPSDIAQAREG